MRHHIFSKGQEHKSNFMPTFERLIGRDIYIYIYIVNLSSCVQSSKGLPRKQGKIEIFHNATNSDLLMKVFLRNGLCTTITISLFFENLLNVPL